MGSVPITPPMEAALERQRELFREKFGREPGPDDPVFFDPDAESPKPLAEGKQERLIVEAMAAAGLDPAVIYAYHRTGFLVTEENAEHLPPDVLVEWNAAIEEYERRTRGPAS